MVACRVIQSQIPAAVADRKRVERFHIAVDRNRLCSLIVDGAGVKACKLHIGECAADCRKNNASLGHRFNRILSGIVRCRKSNVYFTRANFRLRLRFELKRQCFRFALFDYIVSGLCRIAVHRREILFVVAQTNQRRCNLAGFVERIVNRYRNINDTVVCIARAVGIQLHACNRHIKSDAVAGVGGEITDTVQHFSRKACTRGNTAFLPIYRRRAVGYAVRIGVICEIAVFIGCIVILRICDIRPVSYHELCRLLAAAPALCHKIAHRVRIRERIHIAYLRGNVVADEFRLNIRG